MLYRILGALLAILLIALGVLWVAGRGHFGQLEQGGTPVATARTQEALGLAARARRVAAEEIGVAPAKQILFGDLHGHTTFSTDAFTFSLPMLSGEGAHPPADACDFARHCAALDFWSINDHAEELTPRQWRETVETIRQCNAVSGAVPDTMAFLGWEWTQAGTTADNHYGHKNVILRHTDDERIPARPIGASQPDGSPVVGQMPTLARGAAALAFGERFHDWASFLTERGATPRCEPGVPVRSLPNDCIELAATPNELFEKLDEWGHESTVIPHGTTWGVYTPPGSSWDKQLVGGMHDPDRQRLIEIYSGHGASEVYRDWRAVEVGPDGQPSCPAPSPGYQPSCWRAGEIIHERCTAEGEAAEECDQRAAQARANYVEGGIPGHLTVPGVQGSDWLNSGQCADCREPSFNYRPASSAQYMLALGGFDSDGSERRSTPAEEGPRRFRFGFSAASDTHFARPGIGYKELNRIGFTESVARSRDPEALGPLAALIAPPQRDPVARSLPFAEAMQGASDFALMETERSQAFLLTGGLIAVHAERRSRDGVWEGMQRKEVYGTSGPRMLLWFDLLNPPGGRPAPMGSEVEMPHIPIFQARAVGSFEQKPGCPEESHAALGPEELERICKGDCYHPSDRRRLVTEIEVVRIRPQISPDEDLDDLIDDPWRRYPCEADPVGCSVTFSDPEFARQGREALYYVRALEEPKPGINAGGLRCETDRNGRCISVTMCPGPDGEKDDCLASHQPRAWSSPIYLNPAPSQPATEGAPTAQKETVSESS